MNVAEKRIDKRIKALGGKTLNIISSESSKPSPTLIETLDDPHLLSSFVDFMDKDGRLPYLQLYMILSGIEDQVGLQIHSDSWIGNPDPLLLEDLQKVSNDFFVDNSVFIDIDDQLASDFQVCIKRLGEAKSLKNESLEWFKVLKKVKLDVLRQMEIDYALFIKSNTFENQKSSLDFDEEETPMGQFSDRYRMLLDDKDKFKKSFKLSNFFKKNKKERRGVDHIAPSRKDGVDNIEGELQSIITSEETVFGRMKKGFDRIRKNSLGDHSSEDETHGTIPGHTRKHSFSGSILKFLPRSTTEPSFRVHEVVEPSASLSQNGLNSNNGPDSNEINWKNEKILQLEQELAYVEEEIRNIKKEEVDSKVSRQLSLIKRGLQVELEQELMQHSLTEKDRSESVLKVLIICRPLISG